VTVRAARQREVRPAHRDLPKSDPRQFTPDGERKWKVPPHGVKVEKNTAGNGTWIERWPAPAKKGAPLKWVYNYTLAEVQRRAGEKFASNRELAKHIPDIRRQVARDLSGPPGKGHEVAMVMTLIDKLYLRVGGEEGAEHDHFGATTLEKDHVTITGDRVRLCFVGKSGVDWDVSVTDAKLARAMKRQVAHTRGTRVFTVQADDVNAFLAPFGATAKKFRTFHATRLAREELLKHKDAPPAQRSGIVTEMFIKNAARLGHTPAVDRESYVDPMVVKAFMKGRLA
jgi:DNA topoisomerase-1